jgi:nitroreductase
MKPPLKPIETRRSLRSYTGEPLEDWQVDNIVKAFMYAPSAMHYRPCHIIVVRDKGMLQNLSKATPWAKMIEKAGASFVIVGDEERSPWWVEDCSVASENILIEVADMGLGACWVQVRSIAEGMDPEKRVRALLNIPENMRVLNMMAVGVPKRTKEPHKENEVENERLHHESF